MRKFCLASKLAVVAPNETIICHGDFIRRMYVIRRGFVQVISEKQSNDDMDERKIM